MNTPPIIQHSRAWLNRHLIFLCIVLGMGWVLWAGWQAITLWTDNVLPPDRVTAKQIHVNETQRAALVKNISLYQQAITLPAVPSVQFVVTQTTTIKK